MECTYPRLKRDHLVWGQARLGGIDQDAARGNVLKPPYCVPHYDKARAAHGEEPGKHLHQI